jgi:hypothetical protein
MDIIIFAGFWVTLLLVAMYINIVRNPRYGNIDIRPPQSLSAPEKNEKSFKSRLQEEMKYSKVNPWRKEATIIRFPIERTRRSNENRD